MPILRRAKRDVRRLKKLEHPAFVAYGRAFELVVRAVEGRIAPAEKWQAVVDELDRLDHRLYANALRWHLGIHHPFFKPEQATAESRQVAIRNFRDEGVVAPEKLMNYIIPLPRSKDAGIVRL